MKNWLRVQDVAEACTVCERTVRKWIKDGGLRNTKVNGSVFIKNEWLEEFLLKHERNEQVFLDNLVEELTSNL